ncbi:MAG: hypothetical protein H6667_19810 [Ardenticatenaceae bacterium]|nr:hypothetical protein [Ardenticatenaceae bacterium]
MPSPSTSQLPKPKSWDEFEDIVADLIRKLWKDPHISRNGRSGQSQNGVDIFGQPKHINGGYAGIQCKLTDKLTIGTIKQEVKLATTFRPLLELYVIATTMFRDESLQEAIRLEEWPFQIRLMFWEDISLGVSGFRDLLEKHYPGWTQFTPTEELVSHLLLTSQPQDYRYDDATGILFNKKDLDLQIMMDRSSKSDRGFHESWVIKFPDPTAYRQEVYIQYRGTRIMTLYFACVDGGRYYIPLPKSVYDLRITSFQYHIGRIVNHPIPGYNFDTGLKYSGISVTKFEGD